jgi:ADP-ribose pyrophosphatase YjhB (NUDIX family)
MGITGSREKKAKFHQTTMVVAVVVEQKGKILLVCEAKKECRGKWYLPGM